MANVNKIDIAAINGFLRIDGMPLIDPAKLQFIAGYNVRDAFDPQLDQADGELFRSMDANGFITDKPITVRVIDNQAFVIAGHRRVECVRAVNAMRSARDGKKAKLIRGVSFIQETRNADGSFRTPVEMSYDLELSNSGKALTPMERGANILRLRNMGETDETIARRLGITSVGWVAKTAKLVGADKRLKALIKYGVVPPTTGILLNSAHGEEKAGDIAAKAAASAKAAGRDKVSMSKDVAPAEEAVTGTQTVSKRGRKDTLQQNQDRHAEHAAKQGTTMTVAKPAAVKVTKNAISVTYAGPFRLGTKTEERTLIDANGAIVCEYPDVASAKFFLIVNNLGYSAYKGKMSETAAPTVTPDVPAVLPTAPRVAKALTEGKAEREAREKAHAARVASQVSKVAADREARQEAAKEMARAMVAEKADKAETALAAAMVAATGKKTAARKGAARKSK